MTQKATNTILREQRLAAKVNSAKGIKSRPQPIPSQRPQRAPAVAPVSVKVLSVIEPEYCAESVVKMAGNRTPRALEWVGSDEFWLISSCSHSLMTEPNDIGGRESAH